MNHTQAAKRIALQDNKLANGGKAICPTCKAEMTGPKQSKSGEPKDTKQAEGDPALELGQPVPKKSAVPVVHDFWLRVSIPSTIS